MAEVETSVESGKGTIGSEKMMDENIKVLLVDDHQLVREGFRKIIEDRSEIMVVDEAADGEEAIRLAQVNFPDVILMDISMPGMGGIETTRMIKKELPDVRIIGLSLHEEEEVLNDMRKAGATAYLNKNDAFQSLIDTIRAEATEAK